MRNKKIEGREDKLEDKLKVAGILDMSTIDFPGKVCSVVFLVGCPFKCPYCHNHDILSNDKATEVNIHKLVNKLKDNYLIDGICITGGEPLMQKNTIEFAKALKENDLAVKLDTNGYYPTRLQQILPYIDYVAIDFKTSPHKYAELVGLRSDVWQNIEQSFKILHEYKNNNSNFSYEMRTTVVPNLVWEELKDMIYIIDKYNPDRYVLQQFNNENPLDESLKTISPPSLDRMKKLARAVGLTKMSIDVRIRTTQGEFEIKRKEDKTLNII